MRVKNLIVQLFCFITCFYGNTVLAQGTVGGITGQFRNYNPVPSSPNVASFQKYGDLPVNHNTGVPQIEIPIYTVSLNGFSWPISLNYHAGGFKSEDVATRTGLGWNLNANGVISAKYGTFDAGISLDLQRDLNLGSYIVNSDLGSCYYYNTNDLDIANGIVNGVYRVSPDLHYINAGGISGKFLGEGDMLPASDNKISPVRSATANAAIIGWTVRDDNGVLYEFLDFGTTARTSACQGMTNGPVTPSYWLSKITTNKGETITFTYDIETYSYNQPDLHIVKTAVPNQLMGCYSQISPEDYYCQNTVATDEKRLVKINTSTGIEISLVYSGRNDITASTKLDRVKVSDKSSGNPVDVKVVEFDYGYFGTGTNTDNLQLKLNSVGVKDNLSAFIQKYKFTYNNTALPSKRDVSFWEGTFIINEGGLLEKIQYPTGGYTKFEYDILTSTGTARIKNIKDYGINNTETNFRKFEYGPPSRSAYPFSETETIKFFGNPENGGPVTQVNEGHYCGYIPGVEALILSCTKTVKKSTPIKNTLIDLMGDAVRYASITEYFGTNGQNGKIEYNYGSVDFGTRSIMDCDYLVNAELLKSKKVFKKNTDGSYSLLTNISNQYEIPSAFGTFWSPGSTNIKEKTYFIKNVYRTREEMQLTCPQGGQFCFPQQFFVQDFRITSLPLYLKRTTEESYNGSDKLVSVSDYYYGNPLHLKPTKIEVTNSKNELIEITNKYPYDYSGTTVYNEMVTRNNISPVVEFIKKNVTLNNKVLEHQKVTYGFWHLNSIIEPAIIESSVGGATLQLETTINDYTPTGKIKQITQKDGIIKSFIWGYNEQYPVASIINKSYNDAVNQSGLSLYLVNNPQDDNTMRTELAKLRNLTGAFVTSSTYRPLVGVTSETNINNKNIFYSYDGFNRVSSIRDNENNILKKFCYNFYGQIENCAGLGANPVWQQTANTRCKVCPSNTSFYSGTLEVEETDTNPSSGTYGSLRWSDYGVDNSCLPQSDWVIDLNVAPFCDVASGQNTGYLNRLQRNMNPCSPSYMQTRNIPHSQNCNTCPKPVEWAKTGNTRCELNAQGNYTGNIVQEEYNASTCSSIPYGTTRWLFHSYNPTVCSSSGCNSENCSGEAYKCVNNTCELGLKVYTHSELIDPDNFVYNCIYHYEFSDGSWSPNYSETAYAPCL